MKSVFKYLAMLLFCCIVSLHGLSAQDNNRQLYPCKRTQEKIIVDGRIDESAWGAAGEMEMRKIISFEMPESETKVYCLYDEAYLYFAFINYDKDIWSTYKKRDSQLWMEDVIEIFLKPDILKDYYYEFEVSPANTVLDVFLPNDRRQGNMFFRFAEWNCSNFKSAVKIKGTLNNWSDIDRYWVCEIAIPFKSLPSLNSPPKKGDIWLFNVARYDYSVYLKEGVEISSFSRITRLEFHDSKEWAFLKFD